MQQNKKIGFLGFGNMASAMAKGLISQNVISPESIFASAKNWEKLCRNTALLGIQACHSNKELAESADIIILAVKPYQVESVISPIREILKNRLVISIVAGYTFEKYDSLFLPGTHHLSTIPNTPIGVAEGILICEEMHSLTAEEIQLFTAIFSPLALLEWVPTKQLSVAGSLSGCGPAFSCMFIEALADGAVRAGLPRLMAYQLASQMLVGTGKLQLQTGMHPGAMKDAVCSPGGTTIKGVAKLEEAGFRSAVMEAITAIENSAE